MNIRTTEGEEGIGDKGESIKEGKKKRAVSE